MMTTNRLFIYWASIVLAVLSGVAAFSTNAAVNTTAVSASTIVSAGAAAAIELDSISR